jgi:hypothetical protein
LLHYKAAFKLLYKLENLLTVVEIANQFVFFSVPLLPLRQKPPPLQLPFCRYVEDVRRNAKFIKVKIAPRTSNRGITPAPKFTAKPTIHNRTATVKIVQNTAHLLHVWSLFKLRIGSA